MTQQIAIIGAGIAGLSLALAFKRAGISSTIYESAPEIKPVGAGIVMANNAMQIFEKFEIRKQIEKAGSKISFVKITDEYLNPILKVNALPFEKKYGVHNVAIHRADLQQILAEAVGFEQIKLSKRLVSIEKDNNYKLNFEDGLESRCDILFGADGIWSAVRTNYFEIGKIRDTKQRCWRGVTAWDPEFLTADETFEAWGKGKRFGASKINSESVYWFAVINESLLKSNNPNDLFQEFHPKIRNMISKTSPENIVFNNIIDLQPLKTWHRNSICLVGDAAHATTPNMGQGACQAVEDAFVISELFKKEKDIQKVFFQYEKLRRKKVNYIVNTSWKLGKIAHYENGFIGNIRNFFFRNLPQTIQENQMKKVFDIDYF